VPRIQIDPDVIFLIVLPPLLYIAAYFTPIRSLRDNLGTISPLAVGLVIVSAAAVAVGRRVIDAEREALLRLRAEGEINDEVLRELDLEERRRDA
jgi:hypothetical protein